MKWIKSLLGVVVLGTFLVCSPALAKNNKQKNLPPGLQKKVARGKELPPGWQKKIVRGEVLDLDLYKQSRILVPADMNGISTILLGDKKIRLFDATREVIDILEE